MGRGKRKSSVLLKNKTKENRAKSFNQKRTLVDTIAEYSKTVVQANVAPNQKQWQMPIQVFLGSEPNQEKFKKATLDPNKVKPLNGVWTSSLDQEYENTGIISAWHDFSTDSFLSKDKDSSEGKQTITGFTNVLKDAKQAVLKNKFWIMKIKPGTKVFSIRDYNDIEWLQEKYPLSEEIKQQNSFNQLKSLLPNKSQSFIDKDFLSTPLLDYDSLAKDYQGLHFSSKSIKESKQFFMSNDFERKRDWLHSWDVESTVWFEYVFDDFEEIETTRQ